MGWARLDDKRAMHRKLRAAGFAARGLDEAGICQVCGDESDGFISIETVEMIANAHKEKRWHRLVDALVEVGRWEETDGGWMIHDYLDFNPAHADLEARREADRARKRVKDPGGLRTESATDSARNPPRTPQGVQAPPRGRPPARASRPGSSRPVPSRRSQSPPAEHPPQPANTGTGDGLLRSTNGDEPAPIAAGLNDVLTSLTSQALTYRLAKICTGDNRHAINVEAQAVIAWATSAVDIHLVDEAIGWAEQSPQRPVLPRMVAATVHAKAHDHGIQLAPFQPTTRTTKHT